MNQAARRQYHPVVQIPATLSNGTFKHMFRTIEEEITVPTEDLHVFDLMKSDTIAKTLIYAWYQFAKGQGIRIPDTTEEAMRCVVRDVGTHCAWHGYRWQKLGRRIYHVGDELLSAFQATKINAPGNLLKMPAKTFYVSLPPGSMTIYNKVSGEYEPINGFYASEIVFKESGQRVIAILGVGGNDMSSTPDMHTMMQFNLPLDDNPIEDHLVAEVKRFTDAFGENTGRSMDITRILASLCMYLDTEAPEVSRLTPPLELPATLKAVQKKGGKAGQEMIAQYKQRMRHEIWGVGMNFTFSGGSAKSSLSVRTLVTGHFRNQAHGPDHGLRKTIWIQPHWRGEDWMPESKNVVVMHVE